jgi:hypothetical protein
VSSVFEVSPFLHLPFEGFSGNLFDSNGDWVFTVERQGTHDDNGFLKFTDVIDLMPGVNIFLVHSDVTE